MSFFSEQLFNVLRKSAGLYKFKKGEHEKSYEFNNVPASQSASYNV